MTEFDLHYELKGRMSVDGEWTVIGHASTKELLDSMLERHTPTWRYLSWRAYRAAKRLK